MRPKRGGTLLGLDGLEAKVCILGELERERDSSWKRESYERFVLTFCKRPTKMVNPRRLVKYELE